MRRIIRRSNLLPGLAASRNRLERAHKKARNYRAILHLARWCEKRKVGAEGFEAVPTTFRIQWNMRFFRQKREFSRFSYQHFPDFLPALFHFLTSTF
jgi:hypothetical protein